MLIYRSGLFRETNFRQLGCAALKFLYALQLPKLLYFQWDLRAAAPGGLKLGSVPYF